MSDCTVYIDEAGDLGIKTGTKWFVLTAVVVDKADEPNIRAKLNSIKTTLKVPQIHINKIHNFNKRAFIVHELSDEKFTYMNVLVDTTKFDITKIPNTSVAYNYACKYLLQRVSWYLEQNKQVCDVILSGRGTSMDNDLVTYIKDKLLPYSGNQINSAVFNKISAKLAGSWDLLQLADVCATTMFLAYEVNDFGFSTPCYSSVLRDHLFCRDGKIDRYGIKIFTDEMRPDTNELKKTRICVKNERTPGATTT